FATPSLYTIYGQPPRLDGGLVIGISQSGASPDVVAVLAEAQEHAVAATKTYVNSLGAVALLFAEMGNDATAREELARMPEALARQIELSLAETPSLEEYRDAVGLTVVARGVNYGTGFEIALKIRELSGLVTEAYSPADLMHGPIAAIQPGCPVVVVAPSGPARPSVEEIVPPLRARGARLVAVSDVRAVLRRAQTKLVLAPGVPEWLSPLTAVVPGQVAAMRLTRLRGLDLHSPVGLRTATLPR